MRRELIIFSILAVSFCPAKDTGHFRAGFKFQKTYNLHYENGLELGYTHEKLWGHRIQFQLSYVTSRLGSAIGSNTEPQDYYQFSSGLHFRPLKIFDPYLQVNLGYYHYSIDEDFQKAIDIDA